MSKKILFKDKELWAFIFKDEQPIMASQLKVRSFSNTLIGTSQAKTISKVKPKQKVEEKESDVAVLEKPKTIQKTVPKPKQKKKSKKELRREKRQKTKTPPTPLITEKTVSEEVDEVLDEKLNISSIAEAPVEMETTSDESWGDWGLDVEDESLTLEEETAVEELIEEVIDKPVEETVEPEIEEDTDDVGLRSLKEDVFISDATKKEDLKAGLQKTKKGFFARIGKIIAGKTKVSENDLDDIEEALISSDVSLDTTIKIIERLEERVAKDKFLNAAELYSILKEEIVGLLSENNVVDFDDFVIPGKAKPYVMMVVGVNGVGKTTTIGKLAHHFKQRGKTVVLGAADTFRAAAVDQLKIWAKRSGVDIVEKGMDADPSSVAFDTMVSAKAKGADLVLIDTAGRLHNKKGLMEELAKIKRVMSKHIPDAPHDVMLVLDGSTGQNALEQAKQFKEFTQISSLSITKLDGTAKGGVVIAIADQLKIPIRYIGIGEKANHLQVFNKAKFVDTLFD